MDWPTGIRAVQVFNTEQQTQEAWKGSNEEENCFRFNTWNY